MSRSTSPTRPLTTSPDGRSTRGRRAICTTRPRRRSAGRFISRAAIGLGLCIFDAFRPKEAQQLLWEHTPDPEFLADPRKGSPHSRGVAIDLTLLDGDGAPLAMGTAFDAFTPLSHHGCTDIDAGAQRNRFLLLGLMTAAGWDFYRNEWWHYQLFEARSYPLLGNDDLPEPML